jgi:3-hydroxyisobutyrate dehydrogenase-like beta-hydroxyacid dehydrogenase
LDELRPLLAQIGSSRFEIGEQPGLGQMMKLVNNLMAIANQTIAFEALVLGAKGGLDPDLMVEVVNKSTGRSTTTETMVPKAVLTGSFDFGARLAVPYKDLALGLAEAEALGVTMWTTETARQVWKFAIDQGMGEEDQQADWSSPPFSNVLPDLERAPGGGSPEQCHKARDGNVMDVNVDTMIGSPQLSSIVRVS